VDFRRAFERIFGAMDDEHGRLQLLQTFAQIEARHQLSRDREERAVAKRLLGHRIREQLRLRAIREIRRRLCLRDLQHGAPPIDLHPLGIAPFANLRVVVFREPRVQIRHELRHRRQRRPAGIDERECTNAVWMLDRVEHRQDAAERVPDDRQLLDLQLPPQRFQIRDQLRQRKRLRVVRLQHRLARPALMEQHEGMLPAHLLRKRPQVLRRKPGTARQQHHRRTFADDVVIQRDAIVRLEGRRGKRKREKEKKDEATNHGRAVYDTKKKPVVTRGSQTTDN
jgi:hypothetical protein